MNDLVMHSPEAEQSVLGGILIDNDAIEHLIGAGLRPEHFFAARHRKMYSEILRLIGTNRAADVITVYDAMGADSDLLAYLNTLTRNTPSSRNIGHYAGIVRDRAQRRGVLALATDLQSMARESLGQPAGELIDHAQGQLEALAAARTDSLPEAIADGLAGFMDDLVSQDEGTAPKALSTGYPDLDHKLSGGLRGGELIVIAARPKMGKTALALNIANHIAASGVSLVLSMEMPKKQLRQRTVASLGRVDMGYLLNVSTIPQESNQNNDVWARISHGVESASKLRLFTDDQGALSLLDVRTKARSVKRRHGLDVLVIDYLQLMSGEGDNRNAQIEGITRGLKALAKELDCPVILLSQLNRQLENRTDKRPMPSDLRDSGAIEQDCDVALFIYRDEIYHPDSPDRGTAEVNVGLIRQGEPGRVRLAYIGPQTRFESLASGWRPTQTEAVTKPRRKGFDG